jgi:hypothetical protein
LTHGIGHGLGPYLERDHLEGGRILDRTIGHANAQGHPRARAGEQSGKICGPGEIIGNRAE